MKFICIFFHGAMMKRSNMSLTKDEISWACLLYKQLVQKLTKALQEIHLKLLLVFQCEG
jgi:hypothetical protein